MISVYLLLDSPSTNILYPVQVRNTPDSGKCIANSKGVHRELESEGSLRQTSGLTNRNLIQGWWAWMRLPNKSKSDSYPDDCLILCRSKRAAMRVRNSISTFIESRLHLKVNRDKTEVSYAGKVKYLGYSYHMPNYIGAYPLAKMLEYNYYLLNEKPKETAPVVDKKALLEMLKGLSEEERMELMVDLSN